MHAWMHAWSKGKGAQSYGAACTQQQPACASQLIMSAPKVFACSWPRPAIADVALRAPVCLHRSLCCREVLEYHPQVLSDYERGVLGRNFQYPSALDNFKRQFAHLEGGGERAAP